MHKPDRNQHALKPEWIYPLAIALVATAVRLFFWLWAHWTLEDAMIVARVANNFARYGRLTFNFEPITSTATSPLYALLVGGLTAATGLSPIAGAKLLGLVSAVITCVVIYRIYRYLHIAPFPAASVTGLYVFLPPVVAYSVAGLETATYTLIISVAFERALNRHYKQALLAAAAAVVIRIDGIVALAIIGFWIVMKVYPNWRTLPAIILPAAALLLTAVAAHWLYYGSPIPSTILAKSIAYHNEPLKNVSRYLDRMLLSQPEGIPIYLLAAVGIYIAFARHQELLLLAVWYIVYHLSFMLRAPLFSWYLQPPIFVLCLFAGLGLLAIVRRITEGLGLQPLTFQFQVSSGLFISVALMVALIPYGQSRIQQQLYSEQVLMGAGHWLAENVNPNDLVFTETLGYIGYYAPNRFVDWPGLSNPEVPRLLELTHTALDRLAGYRVIIEVYRPSYLVLRENEWEALQNELQAEYQLCQEFIAPEGGDAYEVLCLR